MFSFVPPVMWINTDKIPHTMIKTTQVFHSEAADINYRSYGENRKKHTHAIFHYTIKGSGEVIYKGKAYKTKAGEGFFNIVNEENSGYGYPKDGKEPWEFIVICFDGGNIREAVKELMENKVIYKLKDENNFCVLLKRLLEESGTDMKLTFFPRLISMLSDEENSCSELAKKFKYIVERDLLKNPKISTIAKEIGISREHLQREFLKEAGMPPAKYLNHRRLERLCYLLTTNLTEKEIADIMNFPSLSGMTVFFKKFTGITPNKYRKNGYITI